MAKLVKKKKRSLSSLGSRMSGNPSGETSSLRPYQVTKTPPCAHACPNETDIREFLTTISHTEDLERSYEESFEKAWNILVDKNPFPAICGRVCPHPCEDDCNRAHKDGAVGINKLERFVGDFGLKNNFQFKKIQDTSYSQKVAVVGAGPAGLSCAYQLARRGYPVTVYEAFSKPGGMLKYGIPEYRLPSGVLEKEIKRIEDLGVKIKCNQIVGKDISFEELQNKFDVIFVGIGAHKGKLLGLPNEDASNVLTGVEFLNKINSGESIDVGDKVLVIGGGDTAIDAARVSRRLGADVSIVYRRTRKEMPAIEEEIGGAEEEGVKLTYLASPIGFEKNDGKIVKMKCQKMELGEPDDSGRRRPVPIPDEYFTLDATTVISAISQEPNFDGLDMLRDGKDWIKTDNNGTTEIQKTYAGGDAIELGLVNEAIAHGRKAAEHIHQKFQNIEKRDETNPPIITHDKVVLSYYENIERREADKLSPDERIQSVDREVTATLTQEKAIEEAKRCMSCGSCFDCGVCWSYCQEQAIKKPVKKHEEYKINIDLCTGCKKCADNCPCGYLEMR